MPANINSMSVCDHYKVAIQSRLSHRKEYESWMKLMTFRGVDFVADYITQSKGYQVYIGIQV